MRTPLVLAAGLALTTITIAVGLSGSPLTAARTSTTSDGYVVLAARRGRMNVCQAGERIPKGTSAMRLGLAASTIGPRVTVRATSGSRLLTSGHHGGGWTGRTVTVPLSPVAGAATDATVCVKTGALAERISMTGEQTPAARAARSHGRALGGKLTIEYLRPANSSWWSAVPAIADRMGFDLALGGTWILLIVLGLTLAIACLSSWLVLRELRERP